MVVILSITFTPFTVFVIVFTLVVVSLLVPVDDDELVDDPVDDPVDEPVGGSIFTSGRKSISL